MFKSSEAPEPRMIVTEIDIRAANLNPSSPEDVIYTLTCTVSVVGAYGTKKQTPDWLYGELRAVEGIAVNKVLPNTVTFTVDVSGRQFVSAGSRYTSVEGSILELFYSFVPVNALRLIAEYFDYPDFSVQLS